MVIVSSKFKSYCQRVISQKLLRIPCLNLHINWNIYLLLFYSKIICQLPTPEPIRTASKQRLPSCASLICFFIFSSSLSWFDLIWPALIWSDLSLFDLIRCDQVWCHVIWFFQILSDVIILYLISHVPCFEILCGY